MWHKTPSASIIRRLTSEKSPAHFECHLSFYFSYKTLNCVHIANDLAERPDSFNFARSSSSSSSSSSSCSSTCTMIWAACIAEPLVARVCRWWDPCRVGHATPCTTACCIDTALLLLWFGHQIYHPPMKDWPTMLVWSSPTCTINTCTVCTSSSSSTSINTGT